MELDQWISVFAAVSRTADNRDRNMWSLFMSGIVAASLLVGVTAYALLSFATTADPLSLGAASLGLLLSVVWAVSQYRLSTECAHWRRLLRSIESQFAGAEFHRSLHRLLQGEQICVRASGWLCDEWQSEGVQFPAILRTAPNLMMHLVPLAFVAGFVVLLVSSALGA
ncbi:hypothetical protein JW848_00490 [Candidatus Bipolaricaulota bacterium]|nr:hypothetical protein [Candidatus Bipolaricaulota bacterium]